MFDTARALEQGLGLHRAGRLREAEGLYRRILAAEPDHADGLHLLGVIAYETGHSEDAVVLIGKAIVRNGRVADFHCNIGSALQALGRLNEAKKHYRWAIKLDPNHAESYNNFGNALMEQGRYEEARRQYRRALVLRPSYAEAHSNLGNALLQLGELHPAAHHYRQAILLKPAFAKPHYHLARVLQLQGNFAEAVEYYRRAIELEPGWPEAHRLLAVLLAKLDRLEDARMSFRLAHEADPHAVEGLAEWIEVLDRLRRADDVVNVRQILCRLAPQETKHWFELGLALQKVHRSAEARDAYLRAQELDADFPHLRNNLAAAYIELEAPRQALPLLQTLVGSECRNPLALINMGIAYRQTFDLAGSIAMFERAIAREGTNPLAYSNYGLTLCEQQRWSEAGTMFERALAIDPGFVGARWNFAMLQLLLGDYAQGWVNHEARWDGSPELRGKPRLEQPVWDGSPLAGKTLFLWGEQGFGDALQFARYVPLIAERVRREGGRLIYCCFGPLLQLFRRSFAGCFDDIVPETCQPLPQFDCHCPLLSLPLRFDTRLGTVPGRTPYLEVSEEKVLAWRARLASERRLKVGLVWSGKPTHQRNPFRAVGIDAYASAFKERSDVAFYSLQFDAAADLRRTKAQGFDVCDYTEEMRDFDDSAAFMRNMDLIVTVCTSTAHLAGAIAARTWLLLDVNPHWVWLTERCDSPWYPTITLYRQSCYRDWNPVLARVSDDLAALAQHYVPDQGFSGR